MKIRKILPIIGISILVYLIYKIGINNIKESLLNVKLFYIILAIIYSFSISIIVLTYKWDLILRKQGIKLNFFYLIKLYLIGLFYGNITPAKVGSLIRASYLKKKIDKPFIECASSIVLERLMDLFALFILSLIGCFLIIQQFPTLLRIVMVSFIIFIILSIILLRKSKMEKLFYFVYTFLMPKPLKNKFGEKLHNSFNNFYDSLPKLRKLTYPLLITPLIWVIINTGTYIIIKAFSLEIPFIYVITFTAIGTVVGTIPITVSGLGTREVTLITLYGIFGIPGATILSMSILAFIIGEFPAVLGFIFSLTEKRVKNEIFDYNSTGSIPENKSA